MSVPSKLESICFDLSARSVLFSTEKLTCTKVCSIPSMLSSFIESLSSEYEVLVRFMMVPISYPKAISPPRILTLTCKGLVVIALKSYVVVITVSLDFHKGQIVAVISAQWLVLIESTTHQQCLHKFGTLMFAILPTSSFILLLRMEKQQWCSILQNLHKVSLSYSHLCVTPDCAELPLKAIPSSRETIQLSPLYSGVLGIQAF